MSMRCEYCGKNRLRGHTVSHAKNRHLRRFKPNLHWRWVTEGGASIHRHLCARCLRHAIPAKRARLDSAKKRGTSFAATTAAHKPLAFATA